MTANRMGTALECAHSALGHRQGVSGARKSRRSEKRLKSVEPGVEPTRNPSRDLRDTINGRGDRKEKAIG